MKTPADKGFRAFQIYKQLDDTEDDTETLINLLHDLFHFSDEMAIDMHECISQATCEYNHDRNDEYLKISQQGIYYE